MKNTARQSASQAVNPLTTVVGNPHESTRA